MAQLCFAGLAIGSYTLRSERGALDFGRGSSICPSRHSTMRPSRSSKYFHASGERYCTLVQYLDSVQAGHSVLVIRSPRSLFFGCE